MMAAARDFSRGNSFFYAVQGCDKAIRQKLDVKSPRFLDEFKRLFAAAVKKLNASKRFEVEIHAVDFQLQLAPPRPTAEPKLEELKSQFESEIINSSIKESSDSIERKGNRDDALAATVQSCGIGGKIIDSGVAVVNEKQTIAIEQRIDSESGKLLLSFIASKQDIIDMFVSNDGSSLLIRRALAEGELGDEETRFALVAAVHADTFTAKYSLKQKRFNLSAKIQDMQLI